MRTLLARVLVVGAVVGLAGACGGSTTPPSDPDATVNPMYDANVTPMYDAPIAMIDAEVPPMYDAMQGGGGNSATEITSAGGRVTGGGMTIDVQMGHWFGQGPATGGGTTVEGGAVIK